MFDEKVLWKERFSKTIKELGRYSRYIFNGHFVIVMVFLIGTAAYYYQEWLKTIPEQFPVALIMAIVLAVFLTFSPIYTFLFEADKVFLLPLENKLSGYFKRSMIVSFIIQAYLLFMALGVFMPMYARVNEGNYQTYLPFFVVLLIMKVVNILTRWKVQYFVETKSHRLDSLVRYAINTVFLFFLFSNAKVFFLLPEIVLLLILLFFYNKNTKSKGLKWEFLIEQEERRMTAFYRFANLFTDVPKLRDRIKRRKWLDWLFAKLDFAQDKTFSHLYTRTFLRAGDYFGLFIRLTVIGGVGIYFISFGLGQILVILLFMYLTGFQLIPLWKHHQNKLWINLYPIKGEVKEQSFKKLLSGLLYVQAILLSLVLLVKGELVLTLISVIAGLGFAFLFTNIFVKKKLQS